jgi:hypothetical protein
MRHFALLAVFSVGCGPLLEPAPAPPPPPPAQMPGKVPTVDFALTSDRPTNWVMDWKELQPLCDAHTQYWAYYPGNFPSQPEWNTEAKMILPDYQAAWSSRGEDLVGRAIDAGGAPFPFTLIPDDMKTDTGMKIMLYLSPGVTGAYDMRSYPFYTYLTSYPVEGNLLKRVWTKDDFTDFYFFHEMMHWYLLHQPWLAKWTPTLDRLYKQYKDDPNYSDINTGTVLIYAGAQIDGGDAYPQLTFNMYNFLGHIHVFVLMKTVLASEPDTWKSVMERSKAFTAAEGDRYYSLAVDTVDAMTPDELQAALSEIVAPKQ